MATATVSHPTIQAPRPATAIPTIEAPAPRNAPSLVQRLWRGALEDRWIVPKLGVLGLAATPQTYAIFVTARTESLGVLLAVVPDMLATILVAWGMFGCLLFLKDSD